MFLTHYRARRRGWRTFRHCHLGARRSDRPSVVETSALPMSIATPPAARRVLNAHTGDHRPVARRARLTHMMARVATVATVCAITVALTTVLAAAVPATLAVNPPAAPNLQLAGNLLQVFTNIRNWLMGILASLATIFLTLGGIRYLIGAGEPEEIHKAKTAFKAAGIGFGLAALAPVVVSVLESLVA